MVRTVGIDPLPYPEQHGLCLSASSPALPEALWHGRKGLLEHVQPQRIRHLIGYRVRLGEGVIEHERLPA